MQQKKVDKIDKYKTISTNKTRKKGIKINFKNNKFAR